MHIVEIIMRMHYLALIIESFCHINLVYVESMKWSVTASVRTSKDNLFSVSESISLADITSIVFRDNFGSAGARFEVVDYFVIKVFKTFMPVFSSAYSLVKGFMRILSRVNNLFVI